MVFFGKKKAEPNPIGANLDAIEQEMMQETELPPMPQPQEQSDEDEIQDLKRQIAEKEREMQQKKQPKQIAVLTRAESLSLAAYHTARANQFIQYAATLD